MASEIGWGIIGAGEAARRFGEGLRAVPGAALKQVWSRRAETATEFAAACGGVTAPTLDALLSSPIDAVYVGTHPDSHRAYSLAAIGAGKHVLCEKPSMLNGRELDEVVEAARAAGLLFMEAMKTPFFPLYRRLRQQLEEDPIGQVGYLRAGSSLADVPAGHPIYDLQLGGGSLLGIAPYEVFLALDWLGPLERMETMGQIGATGIDTFATLQTRHLHGYAQLFCGLGLYGLGDALLAGPEGHVVLAAKWWNPAKATVQYVDGRTVELHVPFASTGFNYEAEHFCELLRGGARESPVLTHQRSREMMAMLDRARAAVGLVYPGEAEQPIREGDSALSRDRDLH